MVAHEVYGLRLTANMAIPGLPPQPDSGTFDVQVRLKDWAPFLATSSESLENLFPSSPDDDQGHPHLHVGQFSGGKYFGFFYGDGVRFAVERQGRQVWGEWPEDYTLEDACTYLIGPVIGFVLRLRGVTCLHAGAVAMNEKAIALVGSPGAGKSTAVAAFAQRGFPVIADDVVALAEDEQKFLVPPAYPRVNLWPDSVRALLGKEDVLPRITPTWGKRYMALADNDSSFASKPLPLGAIYILAPRETALTAPILEEIAGGDALAELVSNTYVNYLLDRDMRSSEFDVLSRLAARIPVRRVRPSADPSAVFELVEAIAQDALRVRGSVRPGAPTGRGSYHV